MADFEEHLANAELTGKLCSICQTTIVGGETVTECPDCRLPFHQECWDENRGCSQYGCESAPVAEKASASAELVSSAWGDQKTCPGCGRPIKARAMKCRFCGAAFGTRAEISKREYAEREYAGADYTKARNQVILLFFAAASGCLTIPALIPLCLLIFKGRVAGIRYRRLPAALKAVCISALGVSGFLTLLLILLIALD